MQQNKQKPPPAEEKEKIESTDLPNPDNKSPGSAYENEEQQTDREELNEKKNEENITWEPGRQPSKRED